MPLHHDVDLQRRVEQQRGHKTEYSDVSSDAEARGILHQMLNQFPTGLRFPQSELNFRLPPGALAESNSAAARGGGGGGSGGGTRVCGAPSTSQRRH